MEVFIYEGSPITFDFGNGNKMVNATQMAKAFGKQPKDFLRLKKTKEYITEISKHLNTPRSGITKVVMGGDCSKQGTWVHNLLALEYSRWLSIEFYFDFVSLLKNNKLSNLDLLLSKYEKKDSEIIIGSVYLMRDDTNDFHKIGYSKNPKYRERTLQSEKPTIVLLRTWQGTMKQEKHLHKVFKSKRIRGEWFDLNENDISKIDQYLQKNKVIHLN